MGTADNVILVGWPAIKEAFKQEGSLGRPPENAFTALTPLKGFAMASGPEWRDQKKVSLKLLRDLGLGRNTMEVHIIDEISKLIAAIEQHNQNGVQVPFEIRKILSPSVSNNIFSLAYGKRYDYSHPRRKMMDDMLDPSTTNTLLVIMMIIFSNMPRLFRVLGFFGLLGTRKTMAQNKEVIEYTRQEIRDHEKTLDKNNIRDFIDGFLVEIAERQKSDPGSFFNHESLLANVIGFFFAGSDTTCLITLSHVSYRDPLPSPQYWAAKKYCSSYLQFRFTMSATKSPKLSVLDDSKLIVTNESGQSFLRSVLQNGAQEHAFYVCDLNTLVTRVRLFRKYLPDVEFHYAMKANSSPPILKMAVNLGLNFDCASKAEISAIVDGLGLSGDRIVYANTIKSKSDLIYARDKGVKLMTFDNLESLKQIKQSGTNPNLLLRLYVDNDHADCLMGEKFGAKMENVAQLLRYAQDAMLNVVGIAFHAGSGLKDALAFADTIADCRKVYDMMTDVGFEPNILDIGGGYPGSENSVAIFEDIVLEIRSSLARHFNGIKIKIIAEPGRFLVSSSSTLVTTVIGKRPAYATEGASVAYYINESTSGQFSEQASPDLVEPKALLNENVSGNVLTTATSILYGQSCYPRDIIGTFMLPELYIGDKVVFPDTGAYYAATTSYFNGFQPPSIVYLIKPENERYLDDWYQFKKPDMTHT
ncbi:Ornithine decarboxylase [Halotydeus destructor]|nr:Ornithine decarboxylase [Halotydeus destructor]